MKNINTTLLYALSVRVWMSLAGLINVFLIVYFTSPSMQGLYYTAGNIINLQVFFELGLSVVLLQSTPHYFASLTWKYKGLLIGEKLDKLRFLVLTRRSLQFYIIAAILFFLILTPFGIWFFSLQEAINFKFILYWIGLILGAAVNIVLLPLLAILEGSNEVKSIYKLKLYQLLTANICGWLALYYKNIWTMLFVNTWISCLFIAVYILINYPLWIYRIINIPKNININWTWKTQIWPMQWRIAVSWMSGYVLNQMMVPLLFYYKGAIDAGKLGITLTAMNMLGLFSITYITINLPKLGIFIAKKDWYQLDKLFFKAFKRSIIILVTLCLFIVGFLLIFSDFYLLKRFLPKIQIVILLFNVVFLHIIGSLALYLRAHKTDPFMIFSLTGAIFMAILSSYSAFYYGSLGICVSFCIINGLYGLPSSIILWNSCRKKWHNL